MQMKSHGLIGWIRSRSHWRRIRGAIAEVESAHQDWLRTQANNVPHEAIRAATIGGQIANTTLAGLPQVGDPDRWIACAVGAVAQAVESFRESGMNDEDSFGVASVGRVGHVLRELHEQIYGQPPEVHLDAFGLRQELLRRLADWRRQCGWEAWEPFAGDDVKREHEYLWQHTVPENVPVPQAGETPKEWHQRVSAWARELPAGDASERAGRKGIREVIGRLGQGLFSDRR